MVNETNEAKENSNLNTPNVENYVSSDEELEETDSQIDANISNANYMGMMQKPSVHYDVMNKSEAEPEERLKPKLGVYIGIRMCVVCCDRIREIWNHTIPACGHNIYNTCLLDTILDNGIHPNGTLRCPLCQYM